MTVVRRAFFVLTVLLVFACGQSKKSDEGNNEKPEKVYDPLYANRFKIEYFKDHKKIIVQHPFDSTAAPLVTLLSDNDVFLEKNPTAIKIPVRKWVSVASTQISYANELNVLGELVGMAEPQYVSNPKVQEGLKSGKVKNIGTAFAPDAELLIALNPDMMMISPFKDDFYGPVRNAGVKIATNSSYLENTPLGRVEWLVYVAAFFEKEDEAIATVTSIADRYHEIKKIAQDATSKPNVFLGKTYQGVWYTAAAESYNANFLNDAGVNYVFKDRHGTGSLAYDFETVYEAAGNADVWSLTVNYKGDYGYAALKNEDDRYADFAAFKNRNVIYTNSSSSLIYEKGLLEPDVVLSDLVQLLHPELEMDREPVYYQKLTKE